MLYYVTLCFRMLDHIMLTIRISFPAGCGVDPAFIYQHKHCFGLAFLISVRKPYTPKTLKP